jgi:hypothetical protein
MRRTGNEGGEDAMPKEFDLLDAVAASGLMSAAVLSALVSGLIRKGALTNADGREIYEQALLMLEAQQAEAPHSQPVFKAARELIEQHLRPQPKTP